jgi:hypothetical protein
LAKAPKIAVYHRSSPVNSTLPMINPARNGRAKKGKNAMRNRNTLFHSMLYLSYSTNLLETISAKTQNRKARHEAAKPP